MGLPFRKIDEDSLTGEAEPEQDPEGRRRQETSDVRREQLGRALRWTMLVCLGMPRRLGTWASVSNDCGPVMMRHPGVSQRTVAWLGSHSTSQLIHVHVEMAPTDEHLACRTSHVLSGSVRAPHLLQERAWCAAWEKGLRWKEYH